jgi:hypothetical protein
MDGAPSRRVGFRCAAALVLLLGTASGAHSANLVYAQLTRAGAASPEVTEQMTLIAPMLEAIAQLPSGAELSAAALRAGAEKIDHAVWDAAPLTAGGTPCTRTASERHAREGYVELAATFSCPPGTLVQRFAFLPRLSSQARVILDAKIGADQSEQTLDSARPAATLGRDTEISLWRWISLGVWHIFTGYDHLCFLLALLLVGGSWRQILGMVTAFTVAHSITLAATALNLIPLDDVRARWAEAAIAFSIMYVAAENLMLRRHAHRAAITFGFGLVHGFGFASALREYGIAHSIAKGLFGFNLGVELGQACFVLAVLPIVHLLSKRPERRKRMLWAGSISIFSVASCWFVARVAPVLT